MIWRLMWQLTMWFTPPRPRKRYQAATATAVAIIATASSAFARVDAPLLPTALVEDVKSAAADVEFMDYVGSGQVIKLAPRDVLVLSYLKSCEHETITGGTVAVRAVLERERRAGTARSCAPRSRATAARSG